MCSLFWQGMENDHGDLADIVRAGSGGGTMISPTVEWQFPSQPTNLPSVTNEAFDDFGDPFLGMPDPLLHELDLPSSVFFNGSNSAMAGLARMNIGEDGSGINFLAQKIVGDEMKIRPCNIFSRMIQVSPTTAKMAIMPSGNSPMVATSQREIKPSPIDVNDMIKSNNTVQISAQRSLGIKRRKSQAKKVVCIPAPAAANNRPGGEVVPSDNWHWRKYGQKPIKGSPYPRGYYRCSSSKGCSARKQVERSRNDPNMFVITYTSDHNHPWPTQRNALAGSTRSHPMRNNAAASKNLPFNHTPKPTTSKEEHKDNEADNSSSAITVAGSTSSCGTVKEEMGEREKERPMDSIADEEYEQGFNHSYRSFLLDHSNQSGDFFADLAELEPHPLNPMFSQGFSAEKSDEERATKALDPFNLFDWSEN